MDSLLIDFNCIWLLIVNRNQSLKLRNKTWQHYGFILNFSLDFLTDVVFSGSYNALSRANVRYFKPNPRTLARLPDRHHGWRIRAGSYFLIPYKQAFRSFFPQDWTIFLSFKADSFSQVCWKSKLRWIYHILTIFLLFDFSSIRETYSA